MIWSRRKGKTSDIRRGLQIVTLEGLSSTILFNCLAGPFLTSYLLFLGASSMQIGIALAIPALANMAQLLMAFYMQRVVDRKQVLFRLVMVHRLTWVLSGLIPFLIPGQVGIAIYLSSLFVAFLFNAFAFIVWGSMMGDLIPGKVRGKYFGIRNAATFAVSSMTLIAGGYILDWQPGSLGFGILFLICLTSALINIGAFRHYPNPEYVKSNDESESSASTFIKPFRNRSFLTAMVFISLWSFVQGIAIPFFSYVMQEKELLHISIQTVSVITTVQNIAMLVSYYVWGVISTRLPTRRVMLLTLPFLIGACLLWGTIYMLPTLLVLLVVHILLGIGLSGFNQMMFLFSIGDTPREDRPIYLAVLNAIVGICAFTGPLLGGIIYDAMESHPVWMQEVGVSVMVGIALLIIALALSPIALREPKQTN